MSSDSKSPVNLIGLPHGAMICKTCGKRFLFARELVKHILEVREAEAEGERDDD